MAQGVGRVSAQSLTAERLAHLRCCDVHGEAQYATACRACQSWGDHAAADLAQVVTLTQTHESRRHSEE